MREFINQFVASILVAAISVAFFHWLGLDTAWKVAVSLLFVFGVALVALVWATNTLRKVRLDQRNTVAFGTGTLRLFESIHTLRTRLDSAEQQGSLSSKELEDMQKRFEEPLSMLVTAFSELLSPTIDRAQLAAYLKRPVGEDEVKILAVDGETMRSSGRNPVGTKHTKSPARRKLSGGCTFATWHDGEGPNFVNVVAKEGIVAGSMEKGEFLCITSLKSGAVNSALSHEALPKLLTLVCTMLFQEMDRFERLKLTGRTDF